MPISLHIQIMDSPPDPDRYKSFLSFFCLKYRLNSSFSFPSGEDSSFRQAILDRSHNISSIDPMVHISISTIPITPLYSLTSISSTSSATSLKVSGFFLIIAFNIPGFCSISMRSESCKDGRHSSPNWSTFHSIRSDMVEIHSMVCCTPGGPEDRPVRDRAGQIYL